MGDEVAALQAQLAERDAKILEVKEKAKQFVRDKLKSAQEASAATIDVRYRTSLERATLCNSMAPRGSGR